MDTKLSKNFWQSELECKGTTCGEDGKGCKSYIPNQELVDVLQDIRDHFGKSVRVTSSTRCRIHNKAVGGVYNSKHMLGLAADIQVSEVSPSDVQEYLKTKYDGKYGIGSYTTFTHIDVRDYYARWEG